MGRRTWVVIKLAGEIDLARADELTEVLAKEWLRTQNLLIDFGEVTFMDSSGLRWLFNTYEVATKAGRELRLIVPEGGQVERLLEITGVEQVFPIYRNLDKALERISSGEITPVTDVS